MIRRRARTSGTGVLLIATIALSACGGGPDRLSTAEFERRLGEVCDELQTDFDALGDPESLDELATLGRKGKQLLDDALADFGRIVPPEALAKDYADMLAVVADQSRAAADLRTAATDGDEAAVEAIAARLESLQQEKDEIVADLDVPACLSDPDGSTDTTVPDTAAPVVTSAAPTTVAPVTLPITLVPDTVAPPAPGPADTTATTVPFEILDLAADWQPPAGYELAPNTPDDATLQLFLDDPDLATSMFAVGVADVIDAATGEYVAAVWVGVTYDTSIGMPGRWKDIDCPTGDLVTSPAGIVGILCQGQAGGVFTATDGGIGLSVYATRADVDPVAIADAFLTANL